MFPDNDLIKYRTLKSHTERIAKGRKESLLLLASQRSSEISETNTSPCSQTNKPAWIMLCKKTP
jgi:hypothetical protein